MQIEGITGHLILLMAPMASGKSQLVAHVKQQYPEIVFSVSCTTREPRPGEVDGVDYHFISREEFQAKIEAGEFLEWAEFSANLYGTLKSEMVSQLQSGKIILGEIELQGVQIIETLIPDEHRTLIYIEAGGWDVSLRRAQERGAMDEAHIALRHNRYQEEIKAKEFADVVIENYDGELEAAKKHLDAVIQDIMKKL